MRIYTGKGVYGAIAIGKIYIFSRKKIDINKINIERSLKFCSGK